MFSKLKFNNLVISNKKKIKQARVQIINKLVHKLRKQQQLLIKYPDNGKIKERLRKSNECIEHLKKFKCADVVRQTLLLEKKPMGIITNERATPEEIAVAMLAMNKVMQNLLKQFKETLQLDDEDKSWREVIMKKSKRREKLERTELKKRKRMELKEQKTIERNRKKWMEENATTDSTENNVSLNTIDNDKIEFNESGEWKVEPIDNSAADENYTTNKGNTKKNNKQKPTKSSTRAKIKAEKSQETEHKDCLKEEMTDEVIDNIKTETDSTEEEISTITQEDSDIIPKRAQQNTNEPTAAVPQTSTLKRESVTNKVPVERKKPAYVAPVQEVQKVVDPFFITDSGENYVATVAVIQPTEEDVEEDNDSQQQPMNRRQQREYDRNNFKNPEARGNDRRQNGNDRNYFGYKESHNKSQYNSHSTETEAIDQSLHPSWVAKQKQKPIILKNMPNKKIKFEDGDDGVTAKFADTKELPNKTTNAVANSASDLHPSWAAKQKQKPVILKNMPNKKIKFDDDEVTPSFGDNKPEKTTQTAPNDSASDLHPSWAAKQKLKPVIQAFQGKKITFNDD